MDGKSERTFLAANGPDGFFSLYEKFTEGRIQYIIKGGPGTGKSSVMKRIAAEAAGRGMAVEYVYCSSDLRSLDGIYIRQLNTVVCDGTAPHTLDVTYPGAAGAIINICDCWDEKRLRKSADEIISFNKDIASEYSQMYGCISAAAKIYRSMTAAVEKYTDNAKLVGFAERLAKRSLGERTGKTPKRHMRFLTALTPDGYETFRDTVYTCADRVYVFDDRYGICAPALEAIAAEADRRGCDYYVFCDPLRPDTIAHILIPEFRLCFATRSRTCDIEPVATRRINAARFISNDFFLIKNRLRLCEKLMTACLSAASERLSRAKSLHDDLEELYIPAMDFDKLGSVAAAAMTKIFL